MNNKRKLPLKAISITTVLVLVVASLTILASAFTSTYTSNEDDAWETSRRVVAEIEAKKATDLQAELLLSSEERNAFSQTEAKKESEAYEKDRSTAIARYSVIQDSINVLTRASMETPLSEDDRVTLINLNDEALDLAQRYELFVAISPEAEFQSIIDTLRSEGDSLEHFYSELNSATTQSQVESIQRQIFLAESYVALTDKLQELLNSGASINVLKSFIAENRESILAKSYELYDTSND